jgi:hypothetical protein
MPFDAPNAGHGRKAAAKLLDIEEVPTIRLDGLTKVQIRADLIADNELAESAGWDLEILAIEFHELLALDCLDITATRNSQSENGADFHPDPASGELSPESFKGRKPSLSRGNWTMCGEKSQIAQTLGLNGGAKA